MIKVSKEQAKSLHNALEVVEVYVEELEKQLIEVQKQMQLMADKLKEYEEKEKNDPMV
jgi:uncharacterized coiled-coil protein SlyX